MHLPSSHSPFEEQSFKHFSELKIITELAVSTFETFIADTCTIFTTALIRTIMETLLRGTVGTTKAFIAFTFTSFEITFSVVGAFRGTRFN
jgi:hypothetical protein